jgi:hypothetical protein
MRARLGARFGQQRARLLAPAWRAVLDDVERRRGGAPITVAKPPP